MTQIYGAVLSWLLPINHKPQSSGVTILLYGLILTSLGSVIFDIRRLVSPSSGRPARADSMKLSHGIENTYHKEASSISRRPKKPFLILRVFLVCIALLYLLSTSLSWNPLGSSMHLQTQREPLEVFQVYKPVPTPSTQPGRKECVHEELLMDHVFKWSYGQPFVGKYTPPECDFNHVTINLTVTSAGRQFDRLALMFLGDIEVFRTSTAEPTVAGIIWTYIKDVSPFMTLWTAPRKIIFDLGNLIDDTYTGSFNTTLTAKFSRVADPGAFADDILPISSEQSYVDRSSAFSIPPNIAHMVQSIPLNTSRAIVSIAACGQATEEFWYSNALSSLTGTFAETTGTLYGYSPFREVQLLIDGQVAGVTWPFPTIFTGGIAPGFWRPIVGLDAFDLGESQIDITPFLSLLQDSSPHDFEIRVVGLDDDGHGHATLSQTIGSYWVVTGKIFLFAGQTSSTVPKPLTNIQVSDPSLYIASKHTQNSTGANETLMYFVQAKREIAIISPRSSWIQVLQYSCTNILTSQGITQSTYQTTSGMHISSPLASAASEINYWYPLSINTTFNIYPDDKGFSISATMDRSLNTYMHCEVPNQALFPLPISPGIRSGLETAQFGKATYLSVKGNGSYSAGDTTQYFRQDGYQRHVRAVNGSVVEDEENREAEKEGFLNASSTRQQSTGRGSVKAMLGRGPG